MLLASVSLFLFLFASSEIVAIQITSRSVANYDYGEKGDYIFFLQRNPKIVQFQKVALINTSLHRLKIINLKNKFLWN